MADTSALVSLAFSGRLLPVAETLEIVLPNKVKAELLEIAGFADEKARAAKISLKLIGTNSIRVLAVSNQKKAEDLVDKNIDLGEAECFQLAIEQKIPVLLMDDLNASFALHGLAMVQGIKIKLSAAAIVELAKQQKISKKQAKESMLKMIQHRNWEKTTLDYLIQKYFL